MFDIWHLKKLHGYCVEQVMTVVILGKNSVPGSGCKLHGYSVATVLQWFQSMIQSLVIKTISPFYLVLWALDFSGNSNTESKSSLVSYFLPDVTLLVII